MSRMPETNTKRCDVYPTTCASTCAFCDPISYHSNMTHTQKIEAERIHLASPCGSKLTTRKTRRRRSNIGDIAGNDNVSHAQNCWNVARPLRTPATTSATTSAAAAKRQQHGSAFDGWLFVRSVYSYRGNFFVCDVSVWLHLGSHDQPECATRCASTHELMLTTMMMMVEFLMERDIFCRHHIAAALSEIRYAFVMSLLVSEPSVGV